VGNISAYLQHLGTVEYGRSDHYTSAETDQVMQWMTCYCWESSTIWQPVSCHDTNVSNVTP